MKPILTYVARAVIAAAILFAALNPDGGVIYRNGLSTVALGFIGLGACLHVRKALDDRRAADAG